MSKFIYGIHTVQALLKQKPELFKRVFILEKSENKRLLTIIKLLEKQGIAFQFVRRNFLNKKSKHAVHQGIIAYINNKCFYQESDLKNIILGFNNILLLILDGITDPHNLGACLRNANAAGVNAVIVPKDRTAQLNATARKVACGAAENLPFIRVTNLARTLVALKNYNISIIGSTNTAEHTIYQVKMIGNIALVLGSEGSGIRCLTRKYCDKLVKIPIVANSSISSLNVSVAAGILLFEALRQRDLVI